MTTQSARLSSPVGVHPSTPVLCADLVWRRAESLRPGDEVVSFDEETVRLGNANGGRRYRLGTVTRNQSVVQESCRIVTTRGEVIASADHPFLARATDVNPGPRLARVAARCLVPGMRRLVSIGHPWEAENSRIAGWMAGVLDADGHAFAGGRHGSWVGFGLFLAECDRRGWVTKVIRRDWAQRKTKPLAKNPRDFTDVRINGGMWESCRILGTLRPERLLPVAARMWQGAVVGKTTGDVEIIRVERMSEQPVAAVDTDIRTYVAGGLLCFGANTPTDQ
ncbi:Hint domain-containing protein [Streptomyces sp. NPDC001137]|uniref:Hint domain-containing protein n=1 Tax=Streptomyces sp. NPDC001137 TaxID=3154378 RepID=UPI003318E258